MKKDIYNKIAEISNRSNVELKAEVLELASLSELKSASKQINSIHDKVLNSADAADSAIDKVKKDAQELEKVASSVSRVKAEFSKQAKELGLKPESVKEYNALQAELDSALGTASDIKKVYK